MTSEEISVQAAVMKRMIDKKGSYGYEDIVRYTAEEICRHKGIAITEDFFQGFLEACKLDTERRKREENEKLWRF